MAGGDSHNNAAHVEENMSGASTSTPRNYYLVVGGVGTGAVFCGALVVLGGGVVLVLIMSSARNI